MHSLQALRHSSTGEINLTQLVGPIADIVSLEACSNGYLLKMNKYFYRPVHRVPSCPCANSDFEISEVAELDRPRVEDDAHQAWTRILYGYLDEKSRSGV